MMNRIERATEHVSDLMDEILTNFKPGAKITVLVRTPDNPTADFCMTSDDLDEVLAMVHRRKGEASPKKMGVSGQWNRTRAAVETIISVLDKEPALTPATRVALVDLVSAFERDRFTL